METPMQQPTRILVVGASGFCGNGVLDTLAKDSSMNVWAHVRPESNSLESMKTRCTNLGHSLLVCPIEDLPAQIETIQPQIIGSFIGTTKKKMKPEGLSYEDVDYGINQLLISAAKTLEHQPLFIYTSSMGVEWHKWSPYLKARYLVETDLKDSNLPHIILRPGILSGPTRTEHRPLEHLGAVFSTGLATIADSIGWVSKGDGMRVLNAQQIGTLVHLLIEQWLKQNKSSEHIQTLMVQDIHRILRERNTT